MRKSVTKIVKATVAAAMMIGAGVGAITSSPKASRVVAAGSAVASFSRSGTTDTVTGGDFSFAAEAKTGYYQDGSGTNRYVQILNDTPYWTTTPTSISLTAVIGGGTGNRDLNNPVIADLLDSNGDIIESATTTITSHITTNTGDTYSNVSIAATNNVYGVRVSHVKETSYNVRYYSFSLSFVAAGGGGVDPQPSTFTVTYNANGGTPNTVPSDATNYASGAQVTVLGNTGNITKSGKIWSGWNTAANGSGKSYKAGDTFEISADTTLYARWINDYSDTATLIVTADYLNLNSTGISAAATLTATDGMQYSAAPGGANSVKSTALNGSSSNKFNSEKPVLMGKSGAYIYNNDAFQKNIKKVEVFANYGASTAVSVAVGFGASSPCSSSYTTDAQTLNPYNAVYTFTPAISNAKYFRIQVTNANNAQVQIRITFVIPTTSISVSPALVTLAPNETQQLTATVSPANATDDITYESSAPGVASVNSTGLITAHTAGTATITVTSGEYNGSCSVTVETPAVHFATPTKDSTSGYTGQNDVVEFAYGNLDDSLSVSANNGNVSASIQNDNGVDTAEVKIIFVNAGSSEVYIKDGSSILATINVTITASSVTITGLPSEKALYVGSIRDLGSKISVSAVGSYSEDVTWESGDDSIATVDGSGVVTGVAAGNVDITVTSDDYPSATMTCSVTVYEVPENAYFIDFGPTKNTNPTAIEDDEGFKTAYSFSDSSDVTVSDLDKVYGVSESMLKLGSGKATSSITFTIPSTRYISYISIDIDSVGGSSLNVTSGAVGAEPENQTIAAGILTFDDYLASEKSNSVTLASTANGAFYVSNITIGYASVAKDEVENIQTLAALRFDYSDASEISGAAIRFGGFISQTLWNSLNSESTILGYGVLVAETSYLQAHATTIKDEYEAAISVAGNVDDALELLCGENNGDEDIRRYMANGASPAEANDTQKAFMGVNNAQTYYTWTVRKNFGTNFTTYYSAIAFIKTSNGLVFLEETSTSGKQLAIAALPSIDSELPVYEPIQYIANRP